MGAERYNSSRTPGRRLGARQELRPPEEAGAYRVIDHRNVFPYGRLWQGKSLI
jgi:hypothetical protein